MVKNWLGRVFAPPEVCGPLCKSVSREVESIGRAEALARQAKKQRNRQREQRRR